jgi:hypothetical protein
MTVDSDNVGLFCKNTPHLHTYAKYANMLYVNCFSNGSGTAAVEEYRRRFPISRIPDRTVFFKVCNTLREHSMLPSAKVSPERARQQHVEEQKNVLGLV